jgi:hypothetical protein
MISSVFLAPFYYYQAKNMKAVFDFKDNGGSSQSAKKLKRSSYMPFLTLLMGFLATTAYNRHKKRQENKELLE